MKKIYPVLLSLILIYFSFYYTNKVIDIVRNNDPIMMEIKKNKDKYEVDFVNALVKNNKIIPGKNGIKVNVDKSFGKMKKYGKYNDSLYVFDEVEPEVSIDSYYDKYIESGKDDLKEVALVFKIERFDDIDIIVDRINKLDIKATLFLDGLFVDNNYSKLESIKNKYELELLNYNGSYDKTYFKSGLQSLYNITGVEPKYCFAEYDDKNILTLCSSLGLHTVIPTINTDSLNVVKDKLYNGSIIRVRNIDNLDIVVNYIKQRGYKFMFLNELLLETIEK